MVQYNPLQPLPTAEDLPDSDDTPVDNELQNLVPNLLLAMLSVLWADRMDWFFGVEMGVYYLPGQSPPTPLVPDGFLSLGVDRRKGERGRLSYVLWQENNVVPVLVLEVVSHNYGGEYDTKMSKYKQLGSLYYAIYNPDYWQRDHHEPLEVYQLIDGRYVLLSGEPFWMPAIGLAIGRSQGTYKSWTREWLYWYEQQDQAHSASQWSRSLTPDEQVEQERQRVDQERQRAKQEHQRAEQEHQRAEQERQRAEQAEQRLAQERLLREALLDRLRAEGINVDDL